MFSRAVLDANSPDVRLLMYLTSELDELLRVARVEVPSLVDGERPAELVSVPGATAGQRAMTS